MAFFMLMWLLNATTESQRKGSADYFSPTIPINRISGGGEGMFGGDSVFQKRLCHKTAQVDLTRNRPRKTKPRAILVSIPSKPRKCRNRLKMFCKRCAR